LVLLSSASGVVLEMDAPPCGILISIRLKSRRWLPDPVAFGLRKDSR